MTPDPTNEDQVELVASVAYRFTFHAQASRDSWELTKQRADQGAGYAGAVVEHCYEQARCILEALVN